MNALRPGELERMLGRLDRAPDLTRSVMGRLGYMRVSRRIAARRRRERILARFVTLALLAGGVFAGIELQDRAPTARHAVETTIGDALDHQLERGDTAVRDSLRSIRRFVVPVVPAADVHPGDLEPIERAIERSGIGPVARTGTGDGNSPC